MRPTAKTTIKGTEYVVELLDGDSALVHFGMLSKFLGGPLGRLLTEVRSPYETPDLLAQALSELGGHLASPEFREVAYSMLVGCIAKTKQGPLALVDANGNREVFKGHFRGDFGSLVALLSFAIRENFGDFLDGFPGARKLVEAMQRGAAQKLSQEGTTGGSPG